MIGSGLKKLAVAEGLKVAHGVAYGSLRGFAATLSEGSGFKQIVFVTHFNDPANQTALQTTLNQKNMQREYRVTALNIGPKTIQVTFGDTVGTIKKVSAFLDWFLPLLEANGAAHYNVCAECGGALTGVSWKLVNGVAYPMHEGCAANLRAAVETENQDKKAKGSYLTGLLGALIGALLGAAVWALVLSAGYVAGIVGLLIGFLAIKGYDLLKGKQGKGKVAIVLIAVLLGVVIGNFLPDIVELLGMLSNGELPGMSALDIPALILYLLLESSEYATAVVGNMIIGFLLSGLCVFGLLKKTAQEVSDTKVIDLP